MKTFRIHEADADVIASPLQDLDKQIDALFAELKQKIRDLEAPYRQQLQQQMQQWLATNKQKHEWNKLEEYKAIKDFSDNFREAVLNTVDIDRVLDEYKEKLRQMVQTFMTSYKPPRKTRSDKGVPRTAAEQPAEQPADSVQASPTLATTKEPAPAPVVANTAVSNEPQPQPQPVASQDPTDVKQPTDVKEPADVKQPDPAPVVSPSPQVPDPAPATGDSDELALMKLGAAVLIAKDMTDKEIKDLTPEDLEMAKSVPFNHERFMDSKEMYIQAAKEYKQSLSDSSMGSPTKAGMGEEPKEKKRERHFIIPDNPSREELLEMKPEIFRAYMLKNDSELVDGYQGNWWGLAGEKGLQRRHELVDSHLQWKKHKKPHPHSESLQDMVSRYKQLLRESNRPERLLHEAAKIPFSERVDFYKKKLSCRDMSSTT